MPICSNVTKYEVIYPIDKTNLCQNISYGKEQHPQDNHLHQRQGGGDLGNFFSSAN